MMKLSSCLARMMKATMIHQAHRKNLMGAIGERSSSILEEPTGEKMTPKRTYSEMPYGSDQYFPSNCFNNIVHQPDVLNTESN